MTDAATSFAVLALRAEKCVPGSPPQRIEWVRKVHRDSPYAALTGNADAAARAQKLELKFDTLAAKASDKAEVDLDGALLRLAAQHGLSKKDQDGKATAGDFLSDLKEVHVRHYEFDKAGSYSDQDLAPLRKQVSEGAGWSRILNVKEKDETTEIFVLSQGGKVSSCLILSAEATELSVVASGHTDAGAGKGTAHPTPFTTWRCGSALK
jgi:hypothetical protein